LILEEINKFYKDKFSKLKVTTSPIIEWESFYFNKTYTYFREKLLKRTWIPLLSGMIAMTFILAGLGGINQLDLPFTFVIIGVVLGYILLSFFNIIHGLEFYLSHTALRFREKREKNIDFFFIYNCYQYLNKFIEESDEKNFLKSKSLFYVYQFESELIHQSYKIQQQKSDFHNSIFKQNFTTSTNQYTLIPSMWLNENFNKNNLERVKEIIEILVILEYQIISKKKASDINQSIGSLNRLVRL